MRLVTFKRKDARENFALRLGAFLFDKQQILDFFSALNVAENEFKSPANLLDWFDLEGDLFHKASALYEEIQVAGKVPESLKDSIINSNEVEFLAPIPRPGKLICIGLNYRDHAIESKMPIPERPIVFSKFTTCIVGDNQPVILPPGSEKADYEAELAVIIGRKAKNVSAENAFDYVFGYTNLNDVSERGFQFADGQWQRGKSCDTFAPMGKFIATKDEIPNPHNLSIQFRLNGETLQSSNTNQLIFDIPALIEFLSQSITLEPGDVIATGTPPGVGFARNPPVFLKAGDVMEVEIEGLGILRNEVVN